MCRANGKQSYLLYGQMAYRIQPRRVRVEPVLLAGLLKELMLELDTCWAQALELVSPPWIPGGCVKSVNWIERIPGDESGCQHELSGELEMNRVSAPAILLSSAVR